MQGRIWANAGQVGVYCLGFLRIFFLLNFFLGMVLMARDLDGFNLFLSNPAAFLTREGMQIYLGTVLTLTALLQGLSMIDLREGRNDYDHLEKISEVLSNERAVRK